MSLTEILAEIPKLSFAELQQLIRRTIELEGDELTPEEKILDQRLEDFRHIPRSGTLEHLKGEVLQRLKSQ